ncbi:MAG: hypothetical protein ACLP5H_15735 [Desulfomonilaceae bacterium]
MSSKGPEDPKIPDNDASARTGAQSQRHFGAPIEEDAIPWAEIIFEDEPYPAGEEHPPAREPQSAEISHAEGFFSRNLGMSEENPMDALVVGPPLAVLAVALIVFLLLVET